MKFSSEASSAFEQRDQNLAVVEDLIKENLQIFFFFNFSLN